MRFVEILNRRRATQARTCRNLLTEQKSAAALEFALIGVLYFIILLFVIQGGIFFIRVTVLDFATESVSRAILINGNPGATATPPLTAAAFAQQVASISHGFLNLANIKVELQMAPPLPTSTLGQGQGTGGFQSIRAYNFPAGGAPTYAYTGYGACTVTYQIITYAPNGAVQTIGSDIQTSGTNCTGNGCTVSPAANTANNEIVGGIVDGGTPSATTNGGFTTTTFTGGTFTCNAGQDVLLKVQYTDTSLAGLVSKYFGPVQSVLAFQIEPPPV
jgi:hypothetical protein